MKEEDSGGSLENKKKKKNKKRKLKGSPPSSSRRDFDQPRQALSGISGGKCSVKGRRSNNWRL